MALAALLPVFLNEAGYIGVSQSQGAGLLLAICQKPLPTAVLQVSFDSFTHQFPGCTLVFVCCLSYFSQKRGRHTQDIFVIAGFHISLFDTSRV